MTNYPGSRVAGGGYFSLFAARATPDGYTIMFTNPGPGVHNVLLRKKPSYNGVNKALQMPDLRQRLEQMGVVIEGGTPEKFGALIRSEAKRLAPLIKSGALQVE